MMTSIGWSRWPISEMVQVRYMPLAHCPVSEGSMCCLWLAMSNGGKVFQFFSPLLHFASNECVRVVINAKSGLQGKVCPLSEVTFTPACVSKKQLLGSNIRFNDCCVMDHSRTCLDQRVKQSILVQSRGQVFKWWVKNFDDGHGHDCSIYGSKRWWYCK